MSSRRRRATVDAARRGGARPRRDSAVASGPDRQRSLPGLHLRAQVALLVLVALLVAGAVGFAVLRWLESTT